MCFACAWENVFFISHFFFLVFQIFNRYEVQGNIEVVEIEMHQWRAIFNKHVIHLLILEQCFHQLNVCIIHILR